MSECKHEDQEVIICITRDDPVVYPLVKEHYQLVTRKCTKCEKMIQVKDLITEEVKAEPSKLAEPSKPSRTH